MDGNAEEDEMCVGGDNLGPCYAEVEARAVDTKVGEMWRAGGAECHLDRQAGAGGALGGGVVGKVGDVAPHVEEDQA